MKLRRAIALSVLLCLAVGLVVRSRYPGLSVGSWHQLRYATFAESRNLWHWVAYLLPNLGRLSFDPQAGLYNFRDTPEAGLDSLERGRLAFHRGEFARAAALIEEHVEREGESETALFWLAMSHLRLGEANNCLAQLSTDEHHLDPGLASQLCSLPLRRPHTEREPSRRAAQLFERLLDLYDPENRLYRWLLNFSLMTVDGFPRDVPARYRIETPFIDAFYGAGAERVRRENADLRFTERSQQLGIENLGAGRGVGVEDFDQDGDLDLVLTNLYGGVRYFRNEAGERFVEATRGSGLEAVRQPLTLSIADYDGDGQFDLFILRPYDHFLLFHNEGGGSFRDVTATSGLLDAIPPGTIAASWISTWGDVDRDGDLDLCVTSWAFEVPFLDGLPGRRRLDTKLFLQQDGHFHDANAELGLAEIVHDQHFIGAAFGDYDGDGWLDLYLVGPLPATNVLLHNRAGKGFEIDGRLRYRVPGFTTAFVDVDHDGRLDLFQGGFSDARTAVERTVFGELGQALAGPSTWLIQTPEGRFEPHPELWDGGSMPMGTMGASFGDLDNDGCLDVYLGTGNPEPWFILPNLMYRGQMLPDGRCNGALKNISMLDGFGNVQKGHGIVFFDFDGDGDQDVYSSLGGMWPSDFWPDQLFVNESETTNAWVKIRLRGRRSNRWGLGARIRVRAVDAEGRAIVRSYHMDQKTGFGAAPYLAHIGLGGASRIESVVVWWLGSGLECEYSVPLRALSVLDENDCHEPAQSADLAAPPPADQE